MTDKQKRPRQPRLANVVPDEIAEIQDAADEYIEAVDAASVARQRKREKADALADALRKNRAALEEREDERGNPILVYSRDGVYVSLTERDKLQVKRLMPIERTDAPTPKQED